MLRTSVLFINFYSSASQDAWKMSFSFTISMMRMYQMDLFLYHLVCECMCVPTYIYMYMYIQTHICYWISHVLKSLHQTTLFSNLIIVLPPSQVVHGRTLKTPINNCSVKNRVQCDFKILESSVSWPRWTPLPTPSRAHSRSKLEGGVWRTLEQFWILDPVF